MSGRLSNGHGVTNGWGHTHDIVVAGVGISGPVMAMFLARAGHRVHMLERSCEPTAERKLPASINITLCERGLAALEAVVPRQDVFAISVAVDRRAIHHVDGSVGFQPYSAFGDRLYCVSRNDLRRLLIERAASTPLITIEYGQESVWFDLESKRLEVRDVQSGELRGLRARHLFAADGARSVVRQSMSSAKYFDCMQQYAKHGNLELRVPAAAVPREWKESMCLHIWPRGQHMVIAFPNVDGSYTCTLHMPLEGPDSYASIAGGAGIVGLFRRYFGDLLPLIPDLEEQFNGRRVIAMVMVKCAPWNVGDEVILVGDAAHSVWPSYGQGANATFESCELLARALAGAPRPSWAAAMTEFAAKRRVATDALTDLCVEHFHELREHVGDDRFLLLKTLERELSARTGGQFRSLYEMVSFSRMPYESAWRRAREQTQTLERVLSLPNAKDMILSGNVAGLMAAARTRGINEPWLSER